MVLRSGILSWAAVLLAWELASLVTSPDFLPGPWATWLGALELSQDGSLFSYIGISSLRVLVGWSLGGLAAIPLGLILGRIGWLRALVEPILNFVRFIPPIAFVTLFLLWFGIGETAKVALILYATLFVVLLNTMTGVLSIPEDRWRSAKIMGATEFQTLVHVVLPATVPHIFTGMRLAMGTSFMAIIGAEMMAANEGLGYLIWNSRLYFKTDWIFVGLVTLGLLGFLADRALSFIGNRLLARYGVIAAGKK
jgi:NitT/TauT family transport system permease protein